RERSGGNAMNPVPDICRGDEQVELYFYDELSAGERAAVGAHIAGCDACQKTLADLGTIDAALAARQVDAPPGGDWTPFMSRLDARVERVDRRWLRGPLSGWMQFAAARVLIATGAMLGWTASRATPVTPAVSPVELAL